MKRIFLALAISALLVPALQRAKSAEVSVDFFYNNLSGGNWFEVDDYGYCWQPDAAVNDPNWRPYTDGYWAYTDDGWTWVSYEDFGWATYHYGRWAKLADYGWIWVPGSDLDWGPAWVSWRTGGDYIGWAPLPPRGAGIVYEGQPIGGNVDVEFDIGPEFYNFCDVRFIGEPVLRERIVDPRQNVIVINQTVNVTNITVQNNTVYNYGPDINVVNQRSSRPIQRLQLQRQENVDVASAAKSGGITKVQGNNLVVAAPMKIAKAAGPVAPPRVKTKINQPKIDKGWAGINPSQQAQLKEKIKTEDRSKIPPPTGAGAAATGRAAAGAAPVVGTTPAGPTPAVGTSPAGPTPAVGARGARERGERPRGAVSPPAATGSPATEFERRKGKRGEQPGTPAPAAKPTAAAETGLTSSPPERGVQKGRQGERLGATPPVTAPAPEGERRHEAPTPEGERRHEERGNVRPTPGGPGPSGETLNESRERHRHVEPGGTPGVAGQGAQNQGAPSSEARGPRQRPEGANAPSAGPAAGSATPAARGQGRHEGQTKPAKGSPSPGPQPQ
jgi:hypothetical protein